ncbi:MAG: competence protein CoiA, partial [Promethearchaeota archaeon]
MQFALHKGKRIKADRTLHYASEGYEYLCPSNWCANRELILKKGPVKIPHFAHRKENNCSQNCESETNSHIAMKRFMQRLLQAPDIDVEYSEIKDVRPDLKWEQYAIEVQHSSISVKEIARRNAIYFSNDFTPIWVFHAQDEPTEKYEKGLYKKPYKNHEYRLKDAELFILQMYGFLIYFK